MGTTSVENLVDWVRFGELEVSDVFHLVVIYFVAN